MAYVLGFFAADGYITKSKRGGSYWSIQITELILLREIKRVVQSNHQIGFRKVKTNENPLYRLQIGSKIMCDDLERLGFKSNKTLNMSLPSVPRKYLSSFVRGYFDGDGHVWCGLIHKERPKTTLAIQTVFTSCSRGFLEDLRANLEGVDIIRGVIRKAQGDYFRLTYSINSSLKLYNFMYNDSQCSGLVLSRKKLVFERYLRAKNAAVV